MTEYRELTTDEVEREYPFSDSFRFEFEGRMDRDEALSLRERLDFFIARKTGRERAPVRLLVRNAAAPESFTRLTPRWQHDCDHCRLIAVITDADGQTLDIYLHDYSYQEQPGVIARFGDDGPEYLSGTPTVTIMLGGAPVVLGPFPNEES